MKLFASAEPAPQHQHLFSFELPSARDRRGHFSFFLFPFSFFLLVLVASACSAQARPQFPSFVYGSALSLEAYTIAVQQGDLLENLPCYCGCATVERHSNLKECFLKPDGAFDSHAAGCDLCDQEAIDAATWAREGKSPKEIRALIDSKYSAYGPGTDTPPVP